MFALIPNIGFPEFLLIFFIALLIFGPQKLPEIGRSLGRGLQEFKRASRDMQREMTEVPTQDKEHMEPK